MTKKFLQTGLFRALQNFAELERRIENLKADTQGATNKLKGDAFEVFAAAYLATQRSQMVKRIWPRMQSVPPTIARRLGWKPQDHGSDGLIETVAGVFRGYQAKFRTKRAALPWAEVSTFFGVTDRCDDRLLITNSTNVAEIAEQRSDFISVRGNDLDQLEAADFRAMLEWMRGAAPHRKKATPRPHQREALADIRKAFKKEDRGTVVSACGTGKTFTALWAAEELARRSVIVLVPSLALIRQTLRDWSKNTNWKSFDYVCVCSDPTVSQEEDSLVLRPTELPFSVTNEVAKVRKFLRHPFQGVKVVFTTYQSAPIVGKAMGRGDAFDLGIFDEAHKTSGSEGKRNAFALSDKNLRIRKRLFLTATPRKYRLPSKDSERGKDLEPVYSMDQPEIYGRHIHKLSFGKAAAAGIICDYKVIISVVTSSVAEQTQRRRGVVMVKGDLVKAAQVVNQLAIAQAVRKHKIGKVFSFHRSLASAASFVSDGSEGVQTHLGDFKALHIDGKMSTALREGILREFQEAKRGIVSNVRCLTEGVDVPAVDMVAFMSPKRSKVDIVQAVGRAMRTSPETGKRLGYILVPLHVELKKNESLEDAVKRAGFDDVWQVLAAMQEQDEVLDEAIHQIQADRKLSKGFNDELFRRRVEIVGPPVALAALRKSVTIKCADTLVRPWEENFLRLVAYKKRHGHCNVPRPKQSKATDTASLAYWVNRMRYERRGGNLAEERVRKLDGLGFIWDADDHYWEVMLAELTRFQQKHGHCLVPQRKAGSSPLAIWVSSQRTSNNRTQLEAIRFKRLDQIGFIWDVPEHRWQTQLSLLKLHIKRFGSLTSSRESTDKLSKRVATFLNNMRKKHSEKLLTNRQVRDLETLGVTWKPRDGEWKQRYSELLLFRKKHGHCNVPRGYRRNPKLGAWVTKQRHRLVDQKKNSKRKLLEKLGFEWVPHDILWQTRFRELKAFKNQHGHCNVPQAYPKNPKLGKWVASQRKKNRLRLISKNRLNQLGAVGFVFNTDETNWHKFVAELKAYKQKHGHCNVPAGCVKNRSLASWVHNQRAKAKRGKLAKERLEQLRRLGFQLSRGQKG